MRYSNDLLCELNIQRGDNHVLLKHRKCHPVNDNNWMAFSVELPPCWWGVRTRKSALFHTIAQHLWFSLGNWHYTN